MSMPTITLISPSKTTLISHPSETRTNARDVSFSSYLNGAEESFVLKLGNKLTSNDHVSLENPESDDIELDVFGAEKYFNEVDHNPKPVIAKNLPTHHLPKKDELALELFAIKPQPAKTTTTTTTTRSIRSESSRNSRSSLLQTVTRNQEPKKTNKKGFFARIGCKCSCADESSVVVDDNDENKTDRYDSVKFELGRIKAGTHHFAFPVFNPKPGDVVKTRPGEKDVIVTKRPKSSLQVFGGPDQNGEMCSGLEKKLAMMTWDAIISPEEIKTIPSICSDMRGGGGEESDGDSDASSDLFEIESLSRGGSHAHHNPFRVTPDGCKSPATTTCYAPSEASVEWSVVTASAADFDEMIGPNPNPNPCPKKIGSYKEMPRLRTGILSGCMSQKAVRVGGDYGSGSRRNLRTESFTSATTRFHDEIKFDARNRNRQRSGINAAHLLHV